jgi:hypothetical protein
MELCTSSLSAERASKALKVLGYPVYCIRTADRLIAIDSLAEHIDEILDQCLEEVIIDAPRVFRHKGFGTLEAIPGLDPGSKRAVDDLTRGAATHRTAMTPCRVQRAQAQMDEKRFRIHSGAPTIFEKSA